MHFLAKRFSQSHVHQSYGSSATLRLLLLVPAFGQQHGVPGFPQEGPTNSFGVSAFVYVEYTFTEIVRLFWSRGSAR